MERKLATVMFVDLVDSTALVAGTDPEVARTRVQGFLEGVERCVEAHGGTMGRYAGDAVMVAFGVPQTREDDAMRAVRAGFAILEKVRELELEARVGIESGEIVSDESDLTFATGEAINIAVRLQQAAAPGEILIGPGAHRLSLDGIQTEDLGPIELRGIERSVWARRVICSDEEPRPVSVAAPLVGRVEELDLLHNTFARVARDRRAHVFTLYGEPGVGKSRLGREFLEGVEGATILVGRALPYGEGITYWPVAEMVKVSAGITDDEPVKEAVEKLKVCCEDEAIADLLGLASGVLEAVQSESSQQEIAWAVREWAERLAGVQPLVLVFEDIHWAEEPLLELIEHLAAWVREAPILLLCLARPELLDVRPGWGGGRVRATSIELEPLAPQEVEEMISTLLQRTGLAPEDVAALIEKTGGNPLFVEETIRMLAEEEGAASPERIPDTVQALIAARIDRLDSDERRALRRAAVIGRTFWAGALAHLSPEFEVEPVLESLMLRDFIVPERRSSISGETAFRFKHVLIREVSYGGLSKSERADHHLRFASWLKERAGEELLEVRAYHLDHAASLRKELEGEAPAELAAEAAAALEEAGRRAFARDANRSARRLFLTALELEPTLERRYEAARAAWRITDYPVVSREMEEVCAAARSRGEPQDPGPGADGARRRGRRPRRGRPARGAPDREGTRRARRRGQGGPGGRARGQRHDRLGARRPRRRGAGSRRSAGARARDRPQGPGERGAGHARERLHRRDGARPCSAARRPRARARAGGRRGRRPRPRASLPGAALPRARRLRRGRVPARGGAQVPRGGRAPHGRSGARSTSPPGPRGRRASRRAPRSSCASRFVSSRRSRTGRHSANPSARSRNSWSSRASSTRRSAWRSRRATPSGRRT